jgi:hypothetical protein
MATEPVRLDVSTAKKSGFWTTVLHQVFADVPSCQTYNPDIIGQVDRNRNFLLQKKAFFYKLK